MSGSQAFETLQERTGCCLSCCPHGGMCTLPPGHEGLHVAVDERDRELCRWTDAEAIRREESDQRLAAKGPNGIAAVGLTNWFEALTLFGEDEPDVS